jgi:hypothetical protein
MGQPLTAILSHQGELAAKAHRVTGDLNEANLLVAKVMSRAFQRFRDDAPVEAISASLRSDLDALIRKLRKSVN